MVNARGSDEIELAEVLDRLTLLSRATVGAAKLPISDRLRLAKQLAEDEEHIGGGREWKILPIIISLTIAATLALTVFGFTILDSENHVNPGNSLGAALLLAAVVCVVVGGGCVYRLALGTAVRAVMVDAAQLQLLQTEAPQPEAREAQFRGVKGTILAHLILVILGARLLFG